MTRATLIQAREGNQVAINQVINEYDPLIYHITHNRPVRVGYFDDYIQAGRIGLLEAIKKVSNNSEFKFSTFAGRYIRHEMAILTCQIRGLKWKEYQVISRYYKHLQKMQQELMIEVDMIDVISDMRLFPFEIDIIKSHVRSEQVSVDVSELVARKISSEIEDQELDVLHDGREKMLSDMLDRLTERQADIARKHYYQDLTSRQIAEMLLVGQGYILKELHKIRGKLLNDWPNQLFETAYSSDHFFDPAYKFHREQWKSIDGNKYSVSNYGRVLTYHKGYKRFMIRKPAIESRRYRYHLVLGNTFMKATPSQLIRKYFDLDELPTFYERA